MVHCGEVWCVVVQCSAVQCSDYSALSSVSVAGVIQLLCDMWSIPVLRCCRVCKSFRTVTPGDIQQEDASMVTIIKKMHRW